MATGQTSDRLFAGPVPLLYEQFLVPLLFQEYAQDLARRVAALENVSSLLEVAAGTGVVTRALAAQLPATVAIIATDLNQPMLDHAQSVGTVRSVQWRAADAMNLPFEDASFDVVVCQFGVMFFPDRTAAYVEAARVLRPGGRFLFNVWDRLERNAFAAVITDALAGMFPEDPPMFLGRTPHGYYDEVVIRADLAAAGLAVSAIETLATQSRAASNEIPAIAYCQGTPLRNEIVARGADRLTEATELAATALGTAFGRNDLVGEIKAFVITATRP